MVTHTYLSWKLSLYVQGWYVFTLVWKLYLGRVKRPSAIGSKLMHNMDSDIVNCLSKADRRPDDTVQNSKPRPYQPTNYRQKTVHIKIILII